MNACCCPQERRCGTGRRRRKKRETGVCAKSCSTHTHREDYYCRCSSSIHLHRHRDTKDIVDNARYIMDVSGYQWRGSVGFDKETTMARMEEDIFHQDRHIYTKDEREGLNRNRHTGRCGRCHPKHVHYVDMWIQPTARWRWYISNGRIGNSKYNIHRHV